MSTASPATDADVLDLLRVSGPKDVSELAQVLEVTATAVRQRLSRLLAQGVIDREVVRAGRGRPKHRYRLSPKGLRMTGSNFTDLALALWRAIGSIHDPERRRHILHQIARAMAETYGSRIEGMTMAERMRSLAALLSERRVPFSVDPSQGLPVLTAHACPYPDLAEEDPTICEVEKMLFTELLGEEVELASCRLDGRPSCRFQPA